MRPRHYRIGGKTWGREKNRWKWGENDKKFRGWGSKIWTSLGSLPPDLWLQSTFWVQWNLCSSHPVYYTNILQIKIWPFWRKFNCDHCRRFRCMFCWKHPKRLYYFTEYCFSLFFHQFFSYEIQVEADAQGLGAGRRCFEILEQIADKWKFCFFKNIFKFLSGPKCSKWWPPFLSSTIAVCAFSVN